MRWLLFIAFWGGALLVSGQQSQRSLGQIEPEIRAQLKIARDSLATNLPHAVRAAQKAVELAKDSRQRGLERECYLTLTDIYRHYGQPDLIVRNYDRAIALDQPNTTALHYAKLPYLEEISDRDKAIRDARLVLEIARIDGDLDQQSNALIVLGNVYGKIGNYEQSLKYLTQAEDLVPRSDLGKQAVVQGYIGDNYNRMNQNVLAEQYYRNSIDNGYQAQDTSLIEANFDRMNNLYRQEKRNSDLIALNNSVAKRSLPNAPPKTAPAVADTLALSVANDNNRSRARKLEQKANLNLASAYLDENEGREAIEILEELNEAPQEADLEQNSQVQKLLATAYDRTGEYEKALRAYKDYIAIQDSLLQQKDQKIAASLQKNLALRELENQVTLLEKDREIDAKTIALTQSDMRRQETIITAALLIALVTLASLIVVIRKNRARAKAYNLLELKSLRTKMNPHFIFNSLNSVNHFIAQNDEKSANRYLSQFSRLMREVLDSSDKDFIPLEKEIELLKVYLVLEHQRFANKFDYTFSVDPATRDGDHQIPPMLVQPFIENAIWHGLRYIDYPGKLDVRFLQKSDHLLIEVEDNGIGRPASQALKTKSQIQHNSSGIRHSKSRIGLSNKVYGGSISIQIVDKESNASGTLVQISIANQHEN
ncbi:MAG: histidine kinase [Bacteroidota bacterium]